jgi:TonB family protein
LLAPAAHVTFAQSAAQSISAQKTALPTGYIVFDIPAQSLTSALEVYSVVAGREILYNAKLAVDHQSTAVNGVYTPRVALSMLLWGTGLSARDMANDAVMLQPEARPAPQNLPVNSAPPAVVAQYYGLIQSRLKATFCADNQTQPGEYRVAVSFWIGASGQVSDVEMLGTSGAPARDAMIDHTLRTLAIDVPPPPGFAQPVTLVVAPWSAGMTQDCQTGPAKGYQ